MSDRRATRLSAIHRTDLFDRRRDLMDTWAKFATAKPADVVSIRA